MRDPVAIPKPASRKKRILVFDCWLPGFLYVRHIADREDLDLIFVHNSESQTGQPAREYKEFRARLQIPEWVRDFTEFKCDFNRMFDEVRPDIVLVTSMHYLECRSALMFAKARGVRTAFIPHGIFLLDAHLRRSVPCSALRRLAAALGKLPRAAYYTRLFWSAHFQRHGWRNLRAGIKCWLQLVARYHRWQWSPDAETQSYYEGILDLALVYDLSLQDYYTETSGRIFSTTKFISSGTLDTGKLLAELRKARPEGTRCDVAEKSAYFISSPYPEMFSDKGIEIMGDLMARLKTVVKAGGCDCLIYRAHPGEPAWFAEGICARAGIRLDEQPGLSGLLDAALVCGTSSSLLYPAIKLGKPILILGSDRIQLDKPYYEPLVSYRKVTMDGDLDAEGEAAQHAPVLQEMLRTPPKDDLDQLVDPVDVMMDHA